ncbi:DsrE family protein [bacterium]|nr:DsrE family protein [bacterium]
MAKTITIAVMDAPYESANSTTALRLINAALSLGNNIRVFAYEGAVNLTMKGQQPHANPVKGTSAEEEQHPTTKDWIAALFRLAKTKGVQMEWINCGLCVDERGAVIGLKVRAGPKDFFEASVASDATVVIPTR